MSSADKNGNSKRDILESLAYSLVPDEAALKQLEAQPALPTLTAHLWALFSKLHVRRGYNEGGPVRFSALSLKAWLDIERVRLQPWELDLLFSLDDTFMKVYLDNWKKNNPPSK